MLYSLILHDFWHKKRTTVPVSQLVRAVLWFPFILLRIITLISKLWAMSTKNVCCDINCQLLVSTFCSPNCQLFYIWNKKEIHASDIYIQKFILSLYEVMDVKFTINKILKWCIKKHVLSWHFYERYLYIFRENQGRTKWRNCRLSPKTPD